MNGRNAIRVLAPVLVLWAASASAKISPIVHVRGTIEKVKGNVLTIASRHGSTLTVHLARGYKASVVVKASLSDIKKGSYIGTTALPQPDGTLKALEVHIFPPAQRGVGEGFRPWDLRPGSTMTNATVTSSVKGVNGRTLTLTYKGGDKKVVIPPDIPIVTFASATKADMHAGVAIFAIAKKLPDGTLQASRIDLGKSGVAPPQ